MGAAHPRTTDLIRARGFVVDVIDLSEFAKAEGCVTCLSILVPGQRTEG
jgi:dimethylargininase